MSYASALSTALQEQSAMAEYTGQQGNWREAARLYEELGHDLEAVLGPHDPATLNAYANKARWIEGG